MTSLKPETLHELRGVLAKAQVSPQRVRILKTDSGFRVHVPRLSTWKALSKAEGAHTSLLGEKKLHFLAPTGAIEFVQDKALRGAPARIVGGIPHTKVALSIDLPALGETLIRPLRNAVERMSAQRTINYLRQHAANAPSVGGNAVRINAQLVHKPTLDALLAKHAKAYKLSRRMTFRGLNISIETDKGEKRHWHDPHNHTSGSTLMRWPYGYIRRTEGTDGDHLDVYVGPDESAPNVYIVNQMKAPDFKQFDEQKCMLGFTSEKAAKEAYLQHYNNDRFFGSMITMPFEEFKKKAWKTMDRPTKIANNLGDPNFWAGGTQAQQAPQTPEDVIGLLPAGTFQGMTTRITPDGQKSTSLKVTPAALQAADALAQASQFPGAKIEVQQPEATATGPAKMAGARYALKLCGLV